MERIILLTVGVFALFTCIMTFVYFAKAIISSKKEPSNYDFLYSRFKMYLILSLVAYNISMFINDTSTEEKITLLAASILFYVLLPFVLRTFTNHRLE